MQDTVDKNQLDFQTVKKGECKVEQRTRRDVQTECECASVGV